ncbi:PilW family protein [Ralstonia solanacearum]|uniref:Pilus assembly protein PilW n=1 Tax=Ralstonia solanacearum TaxID=305 RepID=A0AAD0SEU7_RALSL|nr:PilW family protein [Ralstonia solanacearum]AXV82372.1 pilus assembly protein PilW [Ralstonia solanacearum]AXW53496.1 pilus assembly protein PilW [Ralstonia solanacearum]
MRRRSLGTHGASLVELLAGMLIGLIVLGIALQLVWVVRSRYQRLADEASIDDRGTQALELFASALRQAGWVTDTPASSPVRRWPDTNALPPLVGADDCGGLALIDGIHCAGGGISDSDALLVRFAGRSSLPDGLQADGSVVDCSGYGVPERTEGDGDNPRAGFMLFYVGRAESGEPQLMCRTPSRRDGRLQIGKWTSRGMVTGVETMQLLYTLAATPTSPSTTLSARTLTPAQWRRVQAVHIAVVVRGERVHAHARDTSVAKLALFPDVREPIGAAPQDLHFRPTESARRRTVFTATVRLRNPLKCEVDAC